MATTTGPARAGLGRALASPVGVLITVPLLVAAVGVAILLLGRDATRGISDTMARRQLAAQAAEVEHEIGFALDQATPLLGRLAVLADPARDLNDVLVRLHDLVVGRPGVAYASVSFPDGTFRGAYRTESGTVEAQESRITPAGTSVHRFTIAGGELRPLRDEITSYDPRTRGFYKLAQTGGVRAWTAPYAFFASHATGISCTEPRLDDAHALTAVLTVDFDVGALSSYLGRPALEGARSLVVTRDGVVLAYPAGGTAAAAKEDQVLRVADLHDPALDAVIGQLAPSGAGAGDGVRYLEVDAGGEHYLASIAPIGGKRAGAQAPLDWYVATLVPAATLLGPTRNLETRTAIASAVAIAIAIALAMVLAWNLVRMRRQVAASRAEARSAEARAQELGSYRLVARLGVGGMGEVWRAEHRLLARDAAIKLIRPEALHDPAAVAEVRERFRREAQTLASMRSRHTIDIFDYGVTAEGTFYYVMELLDGVDLETLVARYGPQPAPRVIRILAHACASLAEAHAAGLLHRDIKPPNLFTCRAADEVDIVKLLDFGIVQSIHEPLMMPTAAAAIATPSIPATGPKLTQLGAILGTPGFMAPEQILSMPLDGRADLYALGCVAWWLLTGGEVFPREADENAVLRHHMYAPVPSLRDRVVGWLPVELERLVLGCLAKDPSQRPPDARWLMHALRAIAIPPELAWSEERAVAWWQAYQPAPQAQSLPSGEIQLLIPRHHGAPTMRR